LSLKIPWIYSYMAASQVQGISFKRKITLKENLLQGNFSLARQNQDWLNTLEKRGSFSNL